jgi:hypothetical protein
VKRLRHAGKSFIRQFVGREAILAIKVGDEPAVHLEILLAAGVDTLIQPMEKILE